MFLRSLQLCLTFFIILNWSVECSRLDTERENDELSEVFGEDDQSMTEERRFFTNYTSSLVMVNATILVYTVATVVAIVVLLGLLYHLYVEGQAKRSGAAADSYYQSPTYSTYTDQFSARSDDEGHAMDTASILKWIQMLTEMYNDFDYKDIDCQKKYVCEILKDTKLFHTDSLKKGMQYAKYLEVISMPDELRDVLDEYIDAYEVSNGRKECEEYFTCPFSISDSYKRNIVGNEIN